MNKRVLIFLITLIASGKTSLSAQNYSMNGTPVTDCSGTFFDSGGETGNYGNDENLTTTICSDGSNGTHIRLSFSGTDIGPGDQLCFYDGVNLTAPLLSCHTDYNPGQPFLVQATAVNPTGCLTVSFVSNPGGTGTGWAAAISCVPSCQNVLADLVSTNPAAVPADTGWIDICPGERVFFNGMGLYPQNNFAYQQSDFTTTFEWNFGDGGIAYGPNTSHRFDQPGGYYVQLFLTDVQGCKNTNLINQRIRVSPKPNFQVLSAIDQTICAGDTIQLSATTGGNANAVLGVTQNVSSFEVEGSRSDSLALPDGTGIPYETTIFFTEFSPGQVLTSANDLESICVTIEHSWARDVEITLSCPNGQSIILHDHPGNFGGQVFLGEPNDNDNVNPVPGLGYDYCWINNAPNPTWITYANTVLNGSGTIPPGDYSTFDPISDLVGCPLNGEWAISVTDWWPIDNGFIFNWSLKFKDELYPNIEQFSPGLLTWEWNSHPSIFYSSTDSIAASPQNAGSAGYRFTVNDGFGCTWDTLLTIAVLPPTHPDCHACGPNIPVLHDTTICASNSVILDASPLSQPYDVVNFEAYPEYRFGNGNHPHSNPFYSPVAVSSLGYNLLTQPAQQITSVCMDIETDYDADLQIFLQAPSGQLLELSTGNGGSGDNYKITCFSPSASTPIIGQPAPFNGTFQPEGNWNALQGAAVNGNWSLRVSDGFAPSQFGTVKWWNIGFNVNNNITYAWTTGANLSCTNCATPTATPSISTTYTVRANDAFGCQYTDTVQINVSNFIPAPTGLAVINQGTADMTFGWDPLPGATGFEVSVDGGPWLPANGINMHTVSGLVIGQTVQLEVRAISAGCNPVSATSSGTFVNCTMVTNLDVIGPVICAGDSTGSADIAVMGGNPPYSFKINNWPTAYSNGNLSQVFPQGNHFVIVRDMVGCADTLNFIVTEPAPILVNTGVVAVDCSGMDTGAASATATGGTGIIAFTWEACSGGTFQTGSSISNLFAGCYEVTATDENLCQAVLTIQVPEPLPFDFMVSETNVSCFGGSDGTATLSVTGATPPYDYLWDNNQSTATASGLPAGFHFVTVTDGNQCQVATVAEIIEPDVLLVDSTFSQAVSCFGGSNGAAGVVMNGGTQPYSFLWSTGHTTAKAQNIGAGNPTVTVTDAAGCTTVGMVSVSEPAALSGTFSNVMDEQCAGNCSGMATISAAGGTSPYSFDWSDPNTPPDSANASNLCAGTYTVTVQDAHGCSVAQNFSISGASPIQTSISQTPPTCVGLFNGTANLTVSGGNGGFQFVWNNGANTASVNNLGCGKHYVTVTDLSGCSKIDSIQLDCPTTVVANTTNIAQVSCFGLANGSLSVQVSGGQLPYSYIWSDPNAQINQQASNLSAGTYTVTITDLNGCTTIASGMVTQPTQLTASANATAATCFGLANGGASASGQGGSGPYNFNWAPAGNGALLSGLAAGTYTVTVSDANQCTATASATVSQPVQPVSVTTTLLQSPCFGSSNGIASASASGGNGGVFGYQWSSGQNTATANNLAAGLYTVTASDAAGCSGTQTLTVQQLNAIVVNVAFVPPTCAGVADAQAAINLISGGLGMGDTAQYMYVWSTPNTIDAPQISGLSGNQTYTVIVSDQQGCTGAFSFNVNEPLAIELTTDIQDVTCSGGSDGSAAITGVGNAVGQVSYLWSNANTTTQINSAAAGNYTVTVTDSKGCTVVQNLQIEEPEPIDLAFDIQPLICAADSNAAISVIASGGIPGYQYLWSNQATSNAISGLRAGVYGVTVTDSNGCTSIGNQIIELPGALQVSTELDDPLCFGAKNGRIHLVVTGGAVPYKYRINDEPFSGSSTFLALGAGIYNMEVTDGNGCQAFIVDTLNQPQPVIAQLPADTTLIFGDSLWITASAMNITGLPEFTWTSNLVEQISCTDSAYCDEIFIKPILSNVYRVKVTDENGCTGTATITVNVKKPKGIYVPTGFSPNGDQNNDVLVVHGLSRQVRKIVSFRLFDRWGELVYQDQDFSVNDQGRGWDGTFRGQPCDPGVYVWILEGLYEDGYTENLKGEVTLIR